MTLCKADLDWEVVFVMLINILVLFRLKQTFYKFQILKITSQDHLGSLLREPIWVLLLQNLGDHQSLSNLDM